MFLFRAGFITSSLLIVFDFIPVVNAFLSASHYVVNRADPPQLRDSLLTLIFYPIIVLYISRLQNGAVIVLDLFDASTQLILKQEGQREEFTNNYQEKEKDAPIIELSMNCSLTTKRYSRS
jgi:hypothetical protein